jgi:hypothetical protein
VAAPPHHSRSPVRQIHSGSDTVRHYNSHATAAGAVNC